MLPYKFQFSVSELGEEGFLELASQYSVVQGLSAIAQIFFASKEIYDARGHQVERYGYAAFGLTVLPYLWMSFLNLIATICEPRYTHSYIVHYRGRQRNLVQNLNEKDEAFEKKIVGAVGVVYGDPEDFSDIDWINPRQAVRQNPGI
jgi:hypothetical protein